MKPVVTASDLARIADGGELGIASDALITPLARDEAARRQITLAIMRDAEDKPIAGVNPTIVAAGSPGIDATGKKVVAIASDHGGYEMKEKLEQYLKDWGYAVIDWARRIRMRWIIRISRKPPQLPWRVDVRGAELCWIAPELEARLPRTRCRERARRYAMIAQRRGIVVNTMMRIF